MCLPHQLRGIKPELSSQLRLKELDELQRQTTVVEIVSMDGTQVEQLCKLAEIVPN